MPGTGPAWLFGFDAVGYVMAGLVPAMHGPERGWIAPAAITGYNRAPFGERTV
jgi:hypothetical protein